MSRSARDSISEESIETAAQFDMTERLGAPSWASKALLAAGLGVPLGIVIADPAAAELPPSSAVFSSSESFATAPMGAGFLSGDLEQSPNYSVDSSLGLDYSALAGFSVAPVQENVAQNASLDTPAVESLAQNDWSLEFMSQATAADMPGPDPILGLFDGRQVAERTEVRPDGYTITTEYTNDLGVMRETRHTREVEFGVDHKPSSVTTSVHFDGRVNDAAYIDKVSFDENGGQIVVVRRSDQTSVTSVDYARVEVGGAAIVGGFRSRQNVPIFGVEEFERFHLESRPDIGNPHDDGAAPGGLVGFTDKGRTRNIPLVGHVGTEYDTRAVLEDRYGVRHVLSTTTQRGDEEPKTKDGGRGTNITKPFVAGAKVIVQFEVASKSVDGIQDEWIADGQLAGAQTVEAVDTNSSIGAVVQPDWAGLTYNRESFGDLPKTWRTHRLYIGKDEIWLSDTTGIVPEAEVGPPLNSEMTIGIHGGYAEFGNTASSKTPIFKTFDLQDPLQPVTIAEYSAMTPPADLPTVIDLTPRRGVEPAVRQTSEFPVAAAAE